MDKRILGISLLLFLGLVLLGCVQSTTPPVTNQVTTIPDDRVVTTPNPNETLPDNVITITVSPAAPKAGEDVTFIADVMAPYSLGWEQLFSFELWVKQFGNWAKTDCSATPCTYVLTAASQGTIEYKVVRTSKQGAVTEEGSYYLDVASTVQTGDTLGPKVTVSHSPENPKAGQSVTITSLINDYSPLKKVEIYEGGEVVKTCAQAVKIMTCQVLLSNLEAGPSTYYVVATDSLNNTTRSADYNYTVDAT